MWAVLMALAGIFYLVAGVYAIGLHNYVGGVVCCLMAFIEGWAVHYELNE